MGAGRALTRNSDRLEVGLVAAVADPSWGLAGGAFGVAEMAESVSFVVGACRTMTSQTEFDLIYDLAAGAFSCRGTAGAGIVANNAVVVHVDVVGRGGAVTRSRIVGQKVGF